MLFLELLLNADGELCPETFQEGRIVFFLIVLYLLSDLSNSDLI